MRIKNIFFFVLLTTGFSNSSLAHRHENSFGNLMLSTSYGVVTTYSPGAGTSLVVLSTFVDKLEDMLQGDVVQAKNDLRGALNGEEPTQLAQAVLKAKAKSLGSAAAQMSDEDLLLATYDQLSELEKTAAVFKKK